MFWEKGVWYDGGRQPEGHCVLEAVRSMAGKAGLHQTSQAAVRLFS